MVKKRNKMRIRTNSSNKPPSPTVDTINALPSIAFASKSKNKFKMIIEELEKDRNLTVKERFDLFLSETSFTALTKIFKAGTIVKQIIWLLIVLGMMSWLSIQCYWLFEKYFSYPVEVKIELKSKPKMEFPSVTVCNRNPVRKSQFEHSPFRNIRQYFEIKEDKSLYDRAVNMMRNDTWGSHEEDEGDGFVISQMKNISFNVWSALNDPATAKTYYENTDQEMASTFAYADMASNLNPSELKMYGHQIEEFLTSCRFGGMLCSPENFTYVHNVKYGNCFTFNAFNNSLPSVTSTYSGPLMGLTLELNIQQKEYIAALAPDAGVRVLVHSRGSFPALEDDGFSIPVGFVTSVGVSLKKITRLPSPHGTCANEGNVDNLYMSKYGTEYEKSTCVKSCQQKIWKEHCGCVLAIFERPANSSICECTNKTQQICLFEHINQMAICETDCPNPCFENKYEPLISMATWPSKDFEDHLDYKITHTSLDFMGDDDDKADSDENLAKIEVYFREMGYENIEQQKSYESQNLISDVGGQLGLWLGLSAITIGEMVEFFMAVFKAVTARVVRRHNKETAVESLESFDRKLSLKDFN